MLTPMEDNTAGQLAAEAGSRQPFQPGFVCFEIDRHKPQSLGESEAELGQVLPLPCPRAWLVDLEYPQT
ncbi:MAG TPA: hypothetical protein VGV14_18230 [Rhodanobacter sp.]|nr:hypothetical protein [Rhodanobacter sp.]